MKKRKIFILGLVFFGFIFLSAVCAQEGGMFSSYLVGTYDIGSGYTVLHLINPTANALEIRIVFFDDNEKLLKCIREKLSQNDLFEIDVRKLKLVARFGVFKIVSLRDNKPFPGLVGFQRHYFAKLEVTECNLASVPAKVLEEELKIILEYC